ncbi:hypothetical protein Tco_0315982 [Tanacetum coccineum]
MSGEATSPDNHMSAVDRRLNIMSGGGTSSNKATLDESASAKELKSDSPLFLDELQVGVTGTIFMMLCRTWDVSAVTGRYLSTNMVVSDARMLQDTSLMLEDPFKTTKQDLEPWTSTWPTKGIKENLDYLEATPTL